MKLIPWKRNFPSLSYIQPQSSESNLSGELPRLFNNFLRLDRELPATFEDRYYSYPIADVSEDAKSYTLTVELPGLEVEDINLKVGEGYITLSGEKKRMADERKPHYIHRESSEENFQRTFYLPDLAASQEVKAHFKNGLLTIFAPKKEESLQSEKSILIESD